MRVGILGSGQLSKMLFLAGARLGLDIKVYSDQKSAFFNQLKQVTINEYNNKSSLNCFLSKVDVVTLENENIPISTVQYIEQQGLTCYPSSITLSLIQDRFYEKSLLSSLSINTANFLQIDSKKQLTQHAKQLGFKGILKKRRFGYDGRGQVHIHCEDDLTRLSETQCEDCILEEIINFQREISVIAARHHDKSIAFYDICENTHQDGILRKTINKIDDPYFEQARQIMIKLLENLNYVGVCCLELFQVNDTLIANEIAPRVHNSGHWTIEGTITNQFESHLRAITKLTMGNTDSIGEFVMYNILSQLNREALLKQYPSAALHDYEKASKPNRKLGHINLMRRYDI